MSEEKRFLSTTGDEHEIERRLLRGLRDAAAPANAKAESWTRLQAQLAATAAVVAGAVAVQSVSEAAVSSQAAAAGAATPTGLAGSGALPAAAMKLGLALLVAGSVTVGAVALWRRGPSTITSRTNAPTLPALAPIVTPLRETQPAPPAPATEAQFAAPRIQRESRPTHARRAEPTAALDPLSVEAAMLTQARAQLRGGDAPAALSTLSRLQSRSRNGALGQEREILTIQALSALGETAAAQRRARAFVESYPDSPHVAQVRGIAHGP